MNAYREQASLMKAMGHPTRLRILDVLAKGEACVCHLTTILKHRQPNISQHLMVLREAGLVQDRRDGLVVYYRLVDHRTAQVIGLTREMLRSRGVEVEFPPIPTSPLKGCPCPKCGGEGPCV